MQFEMHVQWKDNFAPEKNLRGPGGVLPLLTQNFLC